MIHGYLCGWCARASRCSGKWSLLDVESAVKSMNGNFRGQNVNRVTRGAGTSSDYRMSGHKGPVERQHPDQSGGWKCSVCGFNNHGNAKTCKRQAPDACPGKPPLDTGNGRGRGFGRGKGRGRGCGEPVPTEAASSVSRTDMPSVMAPFSLGLGSVPVLSSVMPQPPGCDGSANAMFSLNTLAIHQLQMLQQLQQFHQSVGSGLTIGGAPSTSTIPAAQQQMHIFQQQLQQLQQLQQGAPGNLASGGFGTSASIGAPNTSMLPSTSSGSAPPAPAGIDAAAPKVQRKKSTKSAEKRAVPRAVRGSRALKMVAGTGKIRPCDGGSCQGHDVKRQDTVFLEVSTGSQSIGYKNGRTMSVPTFKNYFEGCFPRGVQRANVSLDADHFKSGGTLLQSAWANANRIWKSIGTM